MNLLITGAYKWSEEQKQQIKTLGYSIDFQQFENEHTFNPEKYDAVICNNLFKHNKPQQFCNLKFIQFICAGVDEKIRKYVKDNNIHFRHAVNVYSIPIAETVIMQILNIYKNSKNFMEQQHEKIWIKDRTLMELYDKKAVIVGYGSIGREIAKRLKAFGVHIAAANRSLVSDELIEEYIPLSALDEKINLYDIVIDSIALCSETEKIISKTTLQCMKNNSLIVNVSRGTTIDEEALIDVLQSGKLLGAALDVTKNEPLEKESKLWELDNVYITPHNAYISEKIDERMFQVIYNNLINFTGEQK